jgi:predicted nucleotidyltransferase
MKFRDRDAPVALNDLIFRTYGYDHPRGSCFCDLEYAPETLYISKESRALRDGLPTKHYKFYFDGGLKFSLNQDPPFKLHHEALFRDLVGVRKGEVSRVVRPDERLAELMKHDGDPLQRTCVEIIGLITESSSLKVSDFGVFGSLAHGFHNPLFSDVDLVIYGIEELHELRSTLIELFKGDSLRNEFDSWTLLDPPAHWNFKHLSKEDYGWHQRRKMIYAVYDAELLGRKVKIEFEPVRRWDEITNEYPETLRIRELGRVEALGEVISGDEGGFMPSIYPVRLEEIKGNIDPGEISRVVSYVEEFRLQAETGDRIVVRGNLEEVETRNRNFHQITLSYGREYFDQILKPVGPRNKT